MDLGVDDAELATCVACGLCLPHCPTYRVTGEEALSPRGRVAAMRQVHAEDAPLDDSFVRSMETCIQCRGCETACPSGVPFGHLIEATRATLAEGRPARRHRPDAPPAPGVPAVPPVPGAAAGGPSPTPPAVRSGPAPARPSWALRLALRTLRWHRLVLAGSSALAVAQRLRLVPSGVSRRLGLPASLPVRRPRLRPTPMTGPDRIDAAVADDVWLFTGCVMDAWMRDVHVDVQRVIEAAGGRVALPGRGAACCGALAQHAGLATDARTLAARTMRALPGDAPILVDAAGCGAMLREYAHLLGTPEASAFSARVQDVHEWLAPRIDRLVAAAGPRAGASRSGKASGRQGSRDDPGARAGGPTVAVQDPCHLRHVQRSHLAVRTVLDPFATLVELDDDGLCCGAGGAYAAVQPDLAAAVRDRKLAAVDRSGAGVVASANPGCALHLAAAGIEVVHPCRIVADALGPPTP